ncbi:hypothetical protein [Isoptericola variabilis]|uniref:Uncharacterized protein n=1 Tax=Isoptericola variabilis (strain 225) TaxID=743718 RepID=F6FWA1_ISOV2|nr:hypothetical protein [Isoptericola variabilis]AEG45645.1 hypothetical protein Isova_2963 [Isoptericola variabilis 225]TWH28807.1 hypothetical protein L600_003700000020 [Isoptericola variabilis J7]
MSDDTRDDATATGPAIPASTLLTLAMVEAPILGAGVVLLAMGVIPLAVFVGIAVVAVVASSLVLVNGLRRARPRPAGHEASDRSGSTIDRSDPFL